MLKRAVANPLARRLVVREFVPLGAWLVTWGLIGWAIGPADAVRLFAANTFVQAARGLSALEMVATVSRRIGQSQLRPARRLAMRFDLLVLLAVAVVTAALAGLLHWRGMEVPAAMVLLVAISLPARHPGGVLVVTRDREVAWRMGAALVGVVGAAIVWKLGASWWQAALVLGLRDWGGLIATAVFARQRAPQDEPDDTPLRFAELAMRTEAAARRRLTYRMAKSVLGALLGPFGSLIARTGRGAKMDARISRMIPRHRGGMALLTLSAAAVMLFFLWVAREPFFLVIASAAARIAGSGGSALLWWRYGVVASADEDDDDD